MSSGGRPGWIFVGITGPSVRPNQGVLTLPRKASMQIVHPFAGSIQRYFDEIADPDRYRPDHCPQCEIKQSLTGHGFYRRTLVDAAFDGVIRVRRYLCLSCKRTVSLLPDFVLPWLRFSISVIALFLAARLLNGFTLVAAAQAAAPTVMTYQRGQFWIRRFQKQAPVLSLALVPLAAPDAKRPIRTEKNKTQGSLPMCPECSVGRLYRSMVSGKMHCS